MGAMGTLASAGAGQLRADGSPHGLRAPERALTSSHPASAPAATPAAPPPAVATDAPATRVVGDDPLIDPVSEQGQRARGLYFSAPVYKRLGAQGIIRKLRAANLNAAVIDMKDGEGRVNYDTQIPSLQPQKHHYVDDMAGFIAELKAGGVYVIARVVCFSDPFLPRAEPDRAVMDNRPRKEGVVWANWGHRNTWLDPYNPKNQQMIADIAKEVEALGVNEIQLDYVRFPVDEATVFAKFPSQVDKPRREVLIDLLKQVDMAIHIPLGCDVFGLTALRRGDPAGLGQSLEDWVPYVEVFSPMLYLNGMNSLIKRGIPARAERMVFAATNVLRERIGPTPVIRPFIQGFATGSDYYTPEFIAEQVRGVYRANGDGFLFWHPGSNYKMVTEGMVGPAMGLSPLQLADRAAKRAELWGAEAIAAREANARPERTSAEPAPKAVPAGCCAPGSAAATGAAPSAAVRARAPKRRMAMARQRMHLDVRVPPGAMPDSVAPEAAAAPPAAEPVPASAPVAASAAAPAVPATIAPGEPAPSGSTALPAVPAAPPTQAPVERPIAAPATRAAAPAPAAPLAAPPAAAPAAPPAASPPSAAPPAAAQSAAPAPVAPPVAPAAPAPAAPAAR